jgi:hypothetical protein
MNDQNLSYLQKSLLNLGFGEKMNEELEKNIKAEKPEFTLHTTQEYNRQNVGYTLHFKKGDEEAYNLLEGRAVYKHLENLGGEKYNAWLIMDKEAEKTQNGNFKLHPFTDNWNYKPERAIDKISIVGIDEAGARDKLLKSLEKGNRHQVTAIKDGKEVKLYLEANPAEHRVNLTNYKGDAQRLEDYKKPEFKQEKKTVQKQIQETSKKKSRGAKMSV